MNLNSYIFVPMKYLESWDFYNVKNYLLAKEYVDNNFLRLKYLLPSDVTLSEGECYEYLINYFTRFPDAFLVLQKLMVDGLVFSHGL